MEGISKNILSIYTGIAGLFITIVSYIFGMLIISQTSGDQVLHFKTLIIGSEAISDFVVSLLIPQYHKFLLYPQDITIDLIFIIPIVLTVILSAMVIASWFIDIMEKGSLWTLFSCLAILLVLSPLLAIVEVILSHGSLHVSFDIGMYLMVLAGIIWLSPNVIYMINKISNRD